ncbi:MAG: FkbM family methyltransferase [Candidatus Magasanikiibacteriota bacterium]
MLSKQIKFNHQNIEINYRDDSDLSVIDEIFVDKMYRSTENIILDNKNCILDIGAHIGLFSIYASVLNPKVKIIALEPEPSNFALMKENLKLNHCKNVVVKQTALIASEESEVTLQLSKNSHNHIVPLLNCYIVDPANKEIEVSATNLEKMILKNKLDKIGLLKMDIEGAEFEIFENVEDGILNIVENIAVEYHETENNKHIDLENIFRSHGFSVEHFPNHYDKKFGLLLCRNKKI